MESFSKGKQFHRNYIVSVRVEFQSIRLLQNTTTGSERRVSRCRKWHSPEKYPHPGQSRERMEIHPEGRRLISTQVYDKLRDNLG